MNIFIESDRSPARNGIKEYSVVLSNKFGSLATHIYTPINDSYHDGHYIPDCSTGVDIAIVAFKERCKKERLNCEYIKTY